MSRSHSAWIQHYQVEYERFVAEELDRFVEGRSADNKTTPQSMLDELRERLNLHYCATTSNLSATDDATRLQCERLGFQRFGERRANEFVHTIVDNRWFLGPRWFTLLPETRSLALIFARQAS